MGDLLSGVDGLLSLGLGSTEYLYKYYTAYHYRHDDLIKTVDRLNDLCHEPPLVLRLGLAGTR